MTTPDFDKYGYTPDVDTRNRFTYTNDNPEPGEPVEVGAGANGEGGWAVFYVRPDGTQVYVDEDVGDRFGAALLVEKVMEEHHAYKSSDAPDFGGTDITGGL